MNRQSNRRPRMAAGLVFALLGHVAAAQAQQPEPAPETPEQAADTEAPDESEAQNEAEAASEAEMSAADAEAREHFRIGKTLYEAGRFEQAAEEFHEAYRLSGRSQLLYNVYVGYRDASNFPKAIEALRAYLEQVENAPDRINLRARLDAMEAAEAERQEHRAAAEAAQSEPPQDEPSGPVEVERSWVPKAMIYGGVALAVMSVGTGITTLALRNDLKETCNADKLCPADEEKKVASAQGLALATDVLLFSGLAIAATGVVLRVTGALDEERQVPVAVGCNGHGCGAYLHGRF